MRTDAHTHKSNVRGCQKGNTLKCGFCCTMAAPQRTELEGRGECLLHSGRSRQHSEDREAEIEVHFVLIVPTAC